MTGGCWIDVRPVKEDSACKSLADWIVLPHVSSAFELISCVLLARGQSRSRFSKLGLFHEFNVFLNCILSLATKKRERLLSSFSTQ